MNVKRMEVRNDRWRFQWTIVDSLELRVGDS